MNHEFEMRVLSHSNRIKAQIWALEKAARRYGRTLFEGLEDLESLKTCVEEILEAAKLVQADLNKELENVSRKFPTDLAFDLARHKISLKKYEQVSCPLYTSKPCYGPQCAHFHECPTVRKILLLNDPIIGREGK